MVKIFKKREKPPKTKACIWRKTKGVLVLDKEKGTKKLEEIGAQFTVSSAFPVAGAVTRPPGRMMVKSVVNL